jgi:hypothetical protein
VRRQAEVDGTRRGRATTLTPTPPGGWPTPRLGTRDCHREGPRTRRPLGWKRWAARENRSIHGPGDDDMFGCAAEVVAGADLGLDPRQQSRSAWSVRCTPGAWCRADITEELEQRGRRRIIHRVAKHRFVVVGDAVVPRGCHCHARMLRLIRTSSPGTDQLVAQEVVVRRRRCRPPARHRQEWQPRDGRDD